MGNSSSSEHPECCPPGSLPSFSAAQAGASAPPTGREIRLGGNARAYVAEPPTGEPVKGAVIIVHDIYGYDSGRTHHVADEVARWGYLVLAADFFGEGLDGVKDERDIFALLSPWRLVSGGGVFYRRARIPFSAVEELVRSQCIPWLRKNGADGLRIGLMGFCWGGWAITRLASSEDFACAVGAHPSPHVQLLQSQGPKLKEVYNSVKIPVLYMPAWNDPGWIKPDGSEWKMIANASPKSRNVYFDKQYHGWVNRGDIRVEKVRKDVEAAMEETRKMFDEFIPISN